MGNLLAKKEADIGHLSPNRLYTHCDWDFRVVRKLILDKKLAPFSIGREDVTERGGGLEECPICFLYYAGGLNRSRCCKKGICTECYLQVRRPTQPNSCPFCNQEGYAVFFNGPLSRDELAKEEQEQLKVLELKVQMRKEEIEQDKAREQEKELKKSMPVVTNQRDILPNSRSQTNYAYSQSLPVSQVPNSSGVAGSPFSASSYPGGNLETPVDNDLEELMILEAIRLSLVDSTKQITPESTPSHHNNNNNDNNDDPLIPYSHTNPGPIDVPQHSLTGADTTFIVPTVDIAGSSSNAIFVQDCDAKTSLDGAVETYDDCHQEEPNVSLYVKN